MIRLYVGSYEEAGTIKYAIYDDRNDEHNIYSENWNKQVFDTEDEACAKLASLEDERAREDQAIPFSLDDAMKYAESHYWKFASTYAKTAPHEYCIKSWLVEEDQLLYERFVATMKTNSVVGFFYGHKNDYLILGKHYYWYMPLPDNLPVDLINRTTVDNLEFRDGAYYYKGNAQCDK
jgi:hypothetical protein